MAPRLCSCEGNGDRFGEHALMCLRESYARVAQLVRVIGFSPIDAGSSPVLSSTST